MADIKRDGHPAMIPGYGQPPEGVRTDHAELPDQGSAWRAATEGKPRERRGAEGQDVEDAPKRAPVEGP